MIRININIKVIINRYSKQAHFLYKFHTSKKYINKCVFKKKLKRRTVKLSINKYRFSTFPYPLKLSGSRSLLF